MEHLSLKHTKKARNNRFVHVSESISFEGTPLLDVSESISFEGTPLLDVSESISFEGTPLLANLV